MLAGLAFAQEGADPRAMTPVDRFDRGINLLEDWIDTELGDWKKKSKLSGRLGWMKERLTSNIVGDCVKKPTQEELDAVDGVSYIFMR